jgi:ATP-dependent helicase/nuclease subunit A
MALNVYKSSAGSGKTFTLVKEYLKLVLDKPKRFRNILGITFTNKAANEMKERILSYLQQLSAPEQNQGKMAIQVLMPELEQTLGIDREKIARRAAEITSLILHNYSDFAIGTIDSFVHRIVRTFARDLHLPINFELELESDDLLSEAVDLMMAGIGADQKLTNILVNYTLDKLDQEKSWDIDQDLKSFATSLLKEDSQLHLEKLKMLNLDDFQAINKSLRKKVVSFENKLSSIANEAMKLIESVALGQNDFYYGKSGVFAYFNRISKEDFSKLKPNSYVIKTIEEGKWASGKADAITINAVESISEALGDKFLDIQLLVSREFKHYQLYKLMFTNIYPVALLNEIAHWVDQIKEAKNIVHISEFNRKIAEVVLNEPVPFIYERLGELYQYFLIDEFQDTSVLQWQNLLPLLENSLGVNNFNLIVGDGKQAIYRWRSGEVEQFANLPNIAGAQDDPLLMQRQLSLQRNYKEQVLNYNYRSTKDVIEFNNLFFKTLSQLLPENLRTIYKDVEQQAGNPAKRGYVRIELQDRKDKEQHFSDYNYERIEATINELIDDKYAFRDIAIICRSNREASDTAQFLMELDIPVVSSQSLLLGSSPQVNFIMSFVKYIHDPQQKLHAAHILAYLNLYDSKTDANSDLFELNNEKMPSDLFDAEIGVFDKFKLMLKKKGYEYNLIHLLGLPVYELCEEIVRLFKLNHKPNAFLQFFLDAVFDFSRKKLQSLDVFIEWWEKQKNKISIILPESLDAIRILSIHKAKGLEFPVVIYPFADNYLKPTNSNIWLSLDPSYDEKLSTAYLPVRKELGETPYSETYQAEMGKSFLDLVNLLYVVMTRASERLYIFSRTAPDKFTEYNSIPLLFWFFLNEQNLFDVEKLSYEFGQCMPRQVSNEEGEIIDTAILDEFISISWHKRLILSTSAEQVWDPDLVDTPAEQGRLIHLLLSKIKCQKDVRKTLEDFVLQAYFTAQEAKALEVKINILIEHASLRKYFSDQVEVFLEKDIMDENGKLLRPDRIVFCHDEVVVIDYKTGGKSPSHEVQVKDYADVLSKMGYTKVKAILVYLNTEPEIVAF